MWIKATEDGLTRAEAVRGVPEEVQNQLEKLEVGHILCQSPPPQLITDLLYTQCQATHLTDAKLSSSPESPPNFRSSHSHLYMIMKAHISSINYIHKKQKIFSEKQKGFRDGLSYSTPQKSKETRGKAITQPRSHPIPKFYIFLMASGDLAAHVTWRWNLIGQFQDSASWDDLGGFH